MFSFRFTCRPPRSSPGGLGEFRSAVASSPTCTWADKVAMELASWQQRLTGVLTFKKGFIVDLGEGNSRVVALSLGLHCGGRR